MHVTSKCLHLQHLPVLLNAGDNLVPRLDFPYISGCSDHDQLLLGPGYCHIHPLQVLEELALLSRLLRAGEYHGIAVHPLRLVNREDHLDASRSEALLQKTDLLVERCDYADLAWLDAAL